MDQAPVTGSVLTCSPAESISGASTAPHILNSSSPVIQRPAGASNQDSEVPATDGFNIHRPSGRSGGASSDRPVVIGPELDRGAPSRQPIQPTKPTYSKKPMASADRPFNSTQPKATGPNRPAVQRHRAKRSFLPSASAVRLAPRWGREAEARFILEDLPPEWHTREIHQKMLSLGNVIDIQIPREQSKPDRQHAYVTFSPPPSAYNAVQTAVVVTSLLSGRKHNITLSYRDPRDNRHTRTQDVRHLTAVRLDFGVMKHEESMLGLHSVHTTPQDRVELSTNTSKKSLEIKFTVPSALMSYDRRTYRMPTKWRYRMRINFAQISIITQMHDTMSNTTSFVLSIDAPPMMYRRTDKPLESHDEISREWHEGNLWYRQTEIEENQDAARQAVKQLQRDNPIIDIGRWLTYRLSFSTESRASQGLQDLFRVLEAHNISPRKDRIIRTQFAATKAMMMWSWLDSPTTALNDTYALSSLSDLQRMAHQMIQLPFKVRYQLESCISHGCIHECNIDRTFLEKLSTMAAESEHGTIRAIKLLEMVVDDGRRFYDPNDIFKKVVPNLRGAFKQRQHATRFIKVLTATVTPTTIYFNAPALEPSNRVIRHFRQHEDRFLRVRFADEKYRGKIYGSEDAQDNEIFTRVKRTMTNGIKVGDRVYEFLAFGNSQFREHGAYFFAAIRELNAAKIREWMGDFSHINVVAKYCSRIGQCLSTTRATQNKTFKKVRIADIERNGFCFSDGVGKISPMLAVLISSEIDMLRPHAGIAKNEGCPYPSAFQFRMGGCKGVLVVDPTMGSDRSVAIRPSQEKFSTSEHAGLEICRISQFTNASLNVQIILVLSALGVDDKVFTDMMDDMLSDIALALINESKAIELLQKNIDLNGTTVQVAQMILDGFMKRQDPFTISCLRLWRSWNLKYLKERQRIFVEHGAFVLGCIDETATLEGHYNDDPHGLPEIFLQIPDREHEGRYRVVEGVCMLARNPSLHPGDVRIVRAVSCKKLMHIRDCVVLPQTGDRDIANMCSGGDLDGDDYLVIWDKKLLPKEWNHSPMDYQAPPPVEANGKITVDDMTSFFVTHMKYDNVGKIATLHKCWADRAPEGVKSSKCLKLAALHSRAVDYAKTGQPALLPKDLHMSGRPHWYEKAKSTYKSGRVIGKLYDRVKRVDFVPTWDFPFDTRILDAYQLEAETLETARDIKEQYDEAIRRIMAKYSIKTEFEVWSTFVLEHGETTTDYKFSVKIGEEVYALKERFQKLCHESISANEQEQKDWSKKGPFVAAMYTITALEVQSRLAECEETKVVAGVEVPVKEKNAQTMPFMSFPWLFPTELGWIANKWTGYAQSMPLRAAISKSAQQSEKTRLQNELLEDVLQPAPLEELVLPNMDMGNVEEEGELLLDVRYTWPELAGVRSLAAPVDAGPMKTVDSMVFPSGNTASGSDIDFEPGDDFLEIDSPAEQAEMPDVDLSDVHRASPLYLPAPALGPGGWASSVTQVQPASPGANSIVQDGAIPDHDAEEEGGASEDEGEFVVLTPPERKSAFDTLQELLES